jgi:hypothetical protein
MKTISCSRLVALNAVEMKRNLLYAVLSTATLIAGSAAQAATVEALTQYCPEGDVFIPADKICAITLGTTVNDLPVLVDLKATAYDLQTAQVEYNLLEPILVTLPGSDGDRVEIDKVSVFLDPVLKFEVSLTDFADPSSFNLAFTSFPFAPSVSVQSSLSGVLTDNNSSQDGVSLTTPALLTYDFLDAAGNTVDSFNFGSSASFPDGSEDSYPYGPLTEKGQLTCDTVGCGSVKLSLAFTGSGGGDRYDFTSRSDVTAAASIPEPSATVSLSLIGLIGLLTLKKERSH